MKYPPHTPLSSPDLIGRSGTPRLLRITARPLEYWIPAFAGKTGSIEETPSW
ncbi:hypothetical protein SAMN05216525_10633 [Bradyrhizobium sp. Gha]|nr:hypothetical protein SAMN05216525_10633 [Bradyrhizobium sp. Gha]